MKKAGIAMSVLLVAMALLPGLFGYFTERQVLARIELLKSGPFLEVTLIDFQRGWFSSTARIHVAAAADSPLPPGGHGLGVVVAAMSARLLAEPLPVIVRIAHGPLAFANGLHFGTSSMTAGADADDPRVRRLQQRLGMPYLFAFRGRTAYGGTLSFDAHLPPATAGAADTPIDFSGARAQGTVQGRHLRAEMTLDHLNTDIELIDLTVEHLRVQADNRLLNRYLLLGQTRVTVDRFVVRGPLFGALPLVDGAELSFQTDADLNAGGTSVNGSTRAGFRHLRVADRFDLGEGELRAAMTNLDIAAWLQLMTRIESLTATDTTPADRLWPTLEPEVRRLLAAGPAIEIDPLTVTINDRRLHAEAQVAVRPSTVEAAGTLQRAGLSVWLSLLEVDAQASVDKVLLQDIATELSRAQIRAAQAAGRPVDDDEIDAMAAAQANLILIVLMSQGVIEERGDQYYAALTVTDSGVSVNGTTLPFSIPGTAR